MRRVRKLLSGVIASTACLMLINVGAPVIGAPAQPFPSLRLFSVLPNISLTHSKGQPVFLNPGVYLASVGGAFEADAQRASYKDPIQLQQVVRGGNELQTRPLPTSLMDGWNGFSKMMRVVATDDSGNVVKQLTVSTCLDGSDEQRVNDQGPANPTFPWFCSSNPFTLGAVWGIDNGWAINPFSFGYYTMWLKDGHYNLTVSMTRRFVDALGISAQDASTTVGVTVTTSTFCKIICPPPPPRPASSQHGGSAAFGPATVNPSPGTMPDLVPLPAWGIAVDNHKKHSYLDFSATVWDSGPAPMVIEGFRRPGTSVMDAFEYFYKDGQVVGRAPAGILHYDSAPGHEHWHFQQFAAYTLLDESMTKQVASRKTGFCLAPTDAIDLTVPGALWRPDSVGLFSQCGDQNAIWTRETLPSGWGDTYEQSLPGQSFDITNLPNGTYWIQIQANPLGQIHEVSTSNDTTYRQVILGGTPGARTVTVPPWNGIDA
jgi:Lysyl oxidase